MQKDLFIKLIEMLRYNSLYEIVERLENTDSLKQILSLNDEEVKDILHTKDSYLSLSKLYLYLKKDELNDDIKDFIKKSIKSKKTNTYYTVLVVDTLKDKNITNILDIIKIINSSKGDDQARATSYVAVNDDVLRRKDFLPILTTISQAKGDDQAINAQIAISNHDLLKIADAVKFIKLIADTDNKSMAKHIKESANSPFLLKYYNAFHFVNIVSEAKGEIQAKQASQLLNCNELLQRPDALQIVAKVANINNEAVVYSVADVAMKLSKYKDVNVLQYMDIIANSVGETQAGFASYIATKEEILKSKQSLSLVKTVSNTKNPRKALALRDEIIDYFESLNNNNKTKIEIVEETNIGDLIHIGNLDNLLGTVNNMKEQEITVKTKVKSKRKVKRY